MLDTVLAHFPELPAARHARAAVLHQTWLALRTPAQLEVQTITATYGADVGRRVRGADRELARARAAYVDALRYGAHAYTLANLAVLDAYANDNALAVQRADSALALAPNDTVVRLNVAAVRYLVGDYARARALLEPIARDVAPAAFDLGRTLLALGDTARAADAFRRYLAVRPPEPWAREVRRLVPAAYTQVPRPTNDEPPTVAGIHLGDSPTAVVARLGEPSEQRADGAARLLVFEPKGLAVVFHDGDAATSIILFAPQAGDLVEGVRVGGAASAAALRLGRPELLAHGAQHFARNGYGVVVEPQDGVIVRVRIVRE
jgi:tetratricopeptide (TPR) repeat protein